MVVTAAPPELVTVIAVAGGVNTGLYGRIGLAGANIDRRLSQGARGEGDGE